MDRLAATSRDAVQKWAKPWQVFSIQVGMGLDSLTPVRRPVAHLVSVVPTGEAEGNTGRTRVDKIRKSLLYFDAFLVSS